MTYTYPNTIYNGGGEELTFVKLVQNNSGSMLEVENKIQPGAGPPMHIHWLQDEILTVVQGTLAAEVAGAQPTYHQVGETITFKKGVAHRFWNAGEDVLICKGSVSPANNLVYFLTKVYESTKANGGHQPSAFDGAFLQLKYKSEFDLVAIPTFVKKFIFPIIVMIGKMTGRYGKYFDAPTAIRTS